MTSVRKNYEKCNASFITQKNVTAKCTNLYLKESRNAQRGERVGCDPYAAQQRVLGCTTKAPAMLSVYCYNSR